MKHDRRISRSGVSKKLRTQFIAGVLVIVPIAAAVLILRWLFLYIDGILQPVAESLFGRAIPGLGFAFTLVLIYVTGVIATSVVGKRLVSYVESLLAKVPLFRYLYTSIKQIMVSFTTPGETRFLQVVLVEFPKKGMRVIGFVTSESRTESGEKLLNVFIPTSPNPTSGYLEIVKESDVIRTNISIDDALKMVLSVGKVSLKEVTDRLGEETPTTQ
ncbi:MAG: DUF502 domain-containing protein [Dehalococcoidia bacterium]